MSKSITEMTITECVINAIQFSGQDGYVMATTREEFNKTVQCGKLYQDADKENTERDESAANEYMADFWNATLGECSDDEVGDGWCGCGNV